LRNRRAHPSVVCRTNRRTFTLVHGCCSMHGPGVFLSCLVRWSSISPNQYQSMELYCGLV